MDGGFNGISKPAAAKRKAHIAQRGFIRNHKFIFSPRLELDACHSVPLFLELRAQQSFLGNRCGSTPANFIFSRRLDRYLWTYFPPPPLAQLEMQFFPNAFSGVSLKSAAGHFLVCKSSLTSRTKPHLSGLMSDVHVDCPVVSAVVLDQHSQGMSTMSTFVTVGS